MAHPAESDSRAVSSNAPDKQVTNGVGGSASTDTEYAVDPKPTWYTMGRPGAPGQTTHLPGNTPRPGSPGTKITEGHLQLTEKLLDEQRRNLQRLPEG